MVTVPWTQAMNIALNYWHLDHVTLIMFSDPDCEVCSEFIPTLEQLENEDYKVVVVENGRYMPFPLTFYPMGYVYIPNCPTQMPMQRQGNAPIELMKEDAALQIRAMKECRDYLELRDEVKNGS